MYDDHFGILRYVYAFIKFLTVILNVETFIALCTKLSMQGKLPRGHWLVVYTSADYTVHIFSEETLKSDNQHLCSIEKSVSNWLNFLSQDSHSWVAGCWVICDLTLYCLCTVYIYFKPLMCNTTRHTTNEQTSTYQGSSASR